MARLGAIWAVKLLPLWTFLASLCIGQLLCMSWKLKRSQGSSETLAAPCESWLAPEKTSLGSSDSWDLGVKLVARPSLCPVKGFSIEELDPESNFRRGVKYGLVSNIENRDHLLPYFLAARDIRLHRSKRRIFLNLGGHFFNGSTEWFIRSYPLDFSEIHVFHTSWTSFRVPPPHPLEDEEIKWNPNESGVRPHGNPVPVTNCVMESIRQYTKFASNKDGIIHFEGSPMDSWNITYFIKEELKVKKEDAFIVKIDIEGHEYDLMRDWLKDPLMVDIVDEVFVEMHYKHSSMKAYNWDKFSPHTREEAVDLLIDLRKRGFFVHAWP